jgi:hypothetical protein
MMTAASMPQGSGILASTAIGLVACLTALVAGCSIDVAIRR